MGYVEVTARSSSRDGPDFEPLEEYLVRHGEWLTRCAFALTEGHDASVHLLQDTMSAARRYYDWVSAVEDTELYVMRILINQFRISGSAGDAVVVLRDWANFSDRRVADMLGCRKATVRSLAAEGLRSNPRRRA
jgi:DNA-directed RNA polymerase specialized sigma24 family protein